MISPPGCSFGAGRQPSKLRVTGRGGRNQELALRVAQLYPRLSKKWVFLSGGTDGRDGPTNAAGGLVDAGSIARTAAAKINIPQILSDNDSYRALEAADDLLITGATGTNVADIQLFLQYT
ncbi:MAG: MOFRL family protein [Planktomarina sp.]